MIHSASVVVDLLVWIIPIFSILVITSKNPVFSVLYLIAVFLGVAVYLVAVGVPYIGLVYLIVYIGAIAILFLFVIIILNLRLSELFDWGLNFTKNLPLGTLFGLLFFFVFYSILPQTLLLLKTLILTSIMKMFYLFLNLIYSLFSFGNNLTVLVAEQNTIADDLYIIFNSLSVETNLSTFSQIESIGMVLYTSNSLWLIETGFIFLLAIVGPINLCINTQALKGIN